MKPPEYESPDLAIDASEAFRGATLTIPVAIRHDWRYRVGVTLIRLGCRVLRCSCRASGPPGPGESS